MVGTVNQRGKIDVPPPQSPGQSRIELCLVFVSFVILSSRFEFHGGWGGVVGCGGVQSHFRVKPNFS